MFTSFACILLTYHVIALIINYSAVKVLVGSGQLSIMFALLEKDMMSGMVRVSLTKAAKHAVWCVALIIIMIIV